MRFDKRSSLARAKDLLGSGDDSVLRYACLELRFTIEALAYNKIRTYASRLPEEILLTWQPPQVIRALQEFEPGSNESFVLRSRREDESGNPTGPVRVLGTHRAMKLSWLRKTYNKLGYYLHAPAVATQDEQEHDMDEPAKLREYLEKVVIELEPIVASPLDSSLAGVIDVECVKCGQVSFRNAEGAKQSRSAVCLNPNCKAEYYVSFEDDGTFEMRLKATDFICAACDQPIEVENRFLTIGYEFACTSCGARHQIAGRQWEYGMIVEDEEPGT
jgi:predicted RNA-binding Zn-ribbon protein involved in translation (DUF1610 family)